jgi:hypothetical protein
MRLYCEFGYRVGSVQRGSSRKEVKEKEIEKRGKKKLSP